VTNLALALIAQIQLVDGVHERDDAEAERLLDESNAAFEEAGKRATDAAWKYIQGGSFRVAEREMRE
jgi:hypothetical protein